MGARSGDGGGTAGFAFAFNSVDKGGLFTAHFSAEGGFGVGNCGTTATGATGGGGKIRRWGIADGGAGDGAGHFFVEEGGREGFFGLFERV